MHRRTIDSAPSRNGSRLDGVLPSANGKHQSPLLAAALEYHARGWSIIPLCRSKPAVKWKRFQRECASEAELCRMFCMPGIDGLAVILGPVSGGLACRDYDVADAYRSWKADHPKSARTLPTVKTARGYHVYFTGPEGFEDFGDGEYRADSLHYCVLPPSRHRHGQIYEWVIPLPDGPLPQVDPVKKGLCNSFTQRTQTTQRTQEMLLGTLGKANNKEDNPEKGKSLSGGTPKAPAAKGQAAQDQAVQDAVAATQPRMVGQRHRKVFELARALKAVPHLAHAGFPVLRPIVESWHRLALPVIGTKDFLETWADFVRGWEKVKHPAGQGPVEEAFRRAAARKPPRKAVELYGEKARIVKLAALCRELQRAAGDADFYLDCRTAGRLLGVSHVSAADWLAVLVADGVLELREQGSRQRRRASSYRYRMGQ